MKAVYFLELRWRSASVYEAARTRILFQARMMVGPVCGGVGLPVTSIKCCCVMLFTGHHLCLQPQICRWNGRVWNRCVWMMWCEKEMFSAGSQGCLVERSQEDPLSSWQEGGSTHLIISSLFFLSLPEEAFSAQYESLKEENGALSHVQKECTAKRYVGPVITLFPGVAPAKKCIIKKKNRYVALGYKSHFGGKNYLIKSETNNIHLILIGN